MTPTRVIIDTDPGIDDALALILAMASPELSVEAITAVAGNVPVAQAARNACAVIDLMDVRPGPGVAAGIQGPLRKALRTSTHYHGEDGLGELSRFRTTEGLYRYPESNRPLVPQDGPTLLADLCAAAPGEIVLICLGPLSNLATAILAQPAKMAKAKEVIIMGGAIEVPGNITPSSEFNIYVDPHAAEIAFASGLPITLVPLDVTQQVILTRAQIEAVVRPVGSRVTQFVCDSTERLFRHLRERTGGDGITLDDPLAVAVAIDPSLVARRPFHVEVDAGDGPARGITVADRRPIRAELKTPPNLQVCMEVDAGRFMSLFLERICRR